MVRIPRNLYFSDIVYASLAFIHVVVRVPTKLIPYTSHLHTHTHSHYDLARTLVL